MGRILPNDLAPDEVVHYTFAGVEFDLGAGDTFETDDRQVLGNAEVHPWLRVDYPERELIAGEPRRTLADRPDLDVLSGMGPAAGDAFDPEKINATEAAKAEAFKNPVALDAGLDQGEARTVSTPEQEIAVTVAADETHDSASSASDFQLDDEQAARAAAGQTTPADPVDPTDTATEDTD